MLRFSGRNAKAERTALDHPNPKRESGHCEVHHCLCSNPARAEEDLVVGAFQIFPTANRDSERPGLISTRYRMGGQICIYVYMYIYPHIYPHMPIYVYPETHTGARG